MLGKGTAGTTDRVAHTEAKNEELVPLLVTKAPEGILLVKLPPKGTLNGTVIIQVPLAGMEPPWASVRVVPLRLTVPHPDPVTVGVP